MNISSPRSPALLAIAIDDQRAAGRRGAEHLQQIGEAEIRDRATDPAEATAIPVLARWRANPSAICERHELPVQRKRILILKDSVRLGWAAPPPIP